MRDWAAFNKCSVRKMCATELYSGLVLFVQKYCATLGSTVLPAGGPQVEKDGEAEAVLGGAAPARAHNDSSPPCAFLYLLHPPLPTLSYA